MLSEIEIKILKDKLIDVLKEYDGDVEKTGANFGGCKRVYDSCSQDFHAMARGLAKVRNSLILRPKNN